MRCFLQTLRPGVFAYQIHGVTLGYEIVAVGVTAHWDCGRGLLLVDRPEV